MQLVDVIEAEIGAPVEAWSSNILTLLFAFDPHMPYALTNLQTVIAFLFGNNVPLNLACQFFAACSFNPLPLVKHNFTYYITCGRNILLHPPEVCITIYMRIDTNIQMGRIRPTLMTSYLPLL